MTLKPYFAGSLATLYLGDCREVAQQLGRKSMDLMIADPPYGVRWRSRNRTEPMKRMSGDDGGFDWPALLGDIVSRLLRAHRHVYVFGYDGAALSKPLRLGGAAELIWDKGQLGLGNLHSNWGPQHETITFGVFHPSSAEREAGAGRLAARLRTGSVLAVPRKNGRQVRRHPTEKPVPLLRQLVESSSIIGETVFDPTAGVGSSGVAALLEGRKWVGIELDEDYCAIAAQRLREAECIVQTSDVL